MKRDLIPAADADSLHGQRVVIDDRRHGRIVDGMRATSTVYQAGQANRVHVITEEAWWRWVLLGEIPDPQPAPAGHVYVEGAIA